MKNTALLIIDMQQAFFNDPTLDAQKSQLTKAVNELINAITKTDGEVYNIRTEHADDRSTWTLNMLRDKKEFLLKDSDETKPINGLEIEGATNLVKTRDSAFFNTTLKDSLHNLGVKTLIVCGVSTHTCVTQTAADAYAANFHVIIAKDAIGDDKTEYHDVSLAQLETDYRQEILSNSAILKRLQVSDT